MMNEENGQTRGHSRSGRTGCLKDIKKYSFLHRSINIWDILDDEVVTATNIHKFKEILD